MKTEFGSTDFRVVHNRDRVPHWPKAITAGGYHHIATEVWYTTSFDYKVCDESGEDETCSNSLWILSDDDHTFYLDLSTDCNNADLGNLNILEIYISDSSLEFYDKFEKFVLYCNATGFV